LHRGRAFGPDLGQENTAAESSNRKLLEGKGAPDPARLPSRGRIFSRVAGGDRCRLPSRGGPARKINVPDEAFREVKSGDRQSARGRRRPGVRRFVHGSTIGVYGQGMEGRIDENSRCSLTISMEKRSLTGKTSCFPSRIDCRSSSFDPETYGPGSKVAEAVQGRSEGRFLHDRYGRTSPPDPHRRPDRSVSPRGGTSGCDREIFRSSRGRKPVTTNERGPGCIRTDGDPDSRIPRLRFSP